MARTLLLSLEDASLTFGGKPLFESITMHINEGDKICLIGRNGVGKTTLMKLINADLDIDSGKRFILKGTTIGYLAQQVDFDPNMIVKDFVMSGFPIDEQTEDKHYLADIVITPLGLTGDEVMKTLSGGQLRRAALAQTLVDEPDILMLDEPTNHLDLAAIEWLEGYLASYRGALVCVSHDRAFLSNVSSKVFWLDRGIIRTCSKGYAHFDEWSEQLMQQEAREIQNTQKKLEAEHNWTQGGVTGRRKRNVRRLRELHKLRDKLKADKASYNKVTTSIKLDPLSPVQASKVIVEFKDVNKNFERDGKKTTILNDFHLRVMRGERIGILGKNGSGKSTFLKLLMNELQPDTGIVKLGKNVEVTYFDQNRSDLVPKNTVWKTLAPDGGDYVYLGAGEDTKPRHVCGYLKDFLFDPRIARDYVGTLSGGQQNRLLLAKILANPGSVMILDEPTNDLDMDTLDMLQEIISDYQGTLFLVSHDRDFLDRTVTKVLAFEGNGVVESHMGGYSDYLEAKGKWKNKAKVTSPAKKQSVVEPITTIPAKTKLSFKIQYELDNLPGKIKATEQEIQQLNVILSDVNLYTDNPEKFDESTTRLAEAEAELSTQEERWLELEEMK